jgi:hypothetical protein
MKLNGLRLDGNFSDSTPNTWAYAKNVLLSKGFDEIVNEKGASIIATLTTTGTIIDYIETPIEKIVFIDESGVGTIKRISASGVVQTVLASAFYDLSQLVDGVYRYIDGVYYYNNLGNLIIAWTDGIQVPMILNCDSVPTINTASDITKLHLFSQFVDPTISDLSIQTGGSLPSAAYYLAVTYIIPNEDNVITNFGHISNPIFIILDDAIGSYKSIQGNAAEEVTNKAILATFTNLDPNYQYFKVAVIKATGISTECYISKQIKITGSDVSVVIADIDQLNSFDLATVLVSNPAFETVGSMTICNSRLRLGDVATFEKLPIADVYENVIDNVSLQWVSDNEVSLAMAKNSYKDGVFTFYNKEFRENEVYAFYIGFRLKTGGYYGIYHIPGRTAIGTEATDTITIDGEVIPEYKVISKGATLASNYYGNFGFWENTNERYENHYGTTLANSKVRHHRFPSAGQLATWIGEYIQNSGIGEIATTSTGILSRNRSAISPGLGYNYYYNIDHEQLTRHRRFNQIPATPGTPYTTYLALAEAVLSINTNLSVTINNYIDSFGANRSGRLTMTISKVNSAGVVTVLYTHEVISTGTFVNSLSNITLAARDSLRIQISGIGGSTCDVVELAAGTGSVINVHKAVINPTARILGLRVSFDYASIPSAIRTELEKHCGSWEVLYAKRTNDNITQLDQSLTLLDPTNSTRFRFYGFDSMAAQLNINPTHALSEFEIVDTDYREISTNTNEVHHWSKLTNRLITKVINVDYLLAYNVTQDNDDYENCFVVTPTSGDFNHKITSLINVKDDLFLDFSKHDLISTGKIFALGTTLVSSLYGGDTYINASSFLVNPSATGYVSGNKTLIWYVPTNNILNAGLRYDSEIDYEKYYPQTNIGMAGYDENGDYGAGDEMFTSYNWDDEGEESHSTDAWQGNWNDGFTHVSGNTYSLSNPIAAVTGNYYQVAVIVTGATSGSMSISFGGVLFEGVYENSAKVIRAVSTANFVVIPSNTFNGTVQFSLKLLSGVFDMQLKYVADMIAAGIANYYIYNNTFHLQNSLKQHGVDTELTKNVYNYPNRIYSSLEQSKDSESLFYRIFKPLDYVDIPTDFGAIHNLFSTDDILYIKTKYGLYRGMVVDQLTTENISVALKTTDVFNRPVQSAFDGKGKFIKSFNKHDAILTPYGLFCVDIQIGQIYLFDSQDNNLTDIGIAEWFKNVTTNLMTYDSVNSPDSGVQLAYDDEHKRVLVTILNNNQGTVKPLTLSYKLDAKMWVSFHSYTPSKYICTSNGVFYINDNILYKLGSGNYGRYDAINYSDSIIDFIFNNNSGARMYLTSVRFTTTIEVNDVKYWDQTLSQIMIYSKNLCTGVVDLTKREVLYNELMKLTQNGNLRFEDGEWIFNDISDSLITPNSKFLDTNFDVISSAINNLKNWYEKSKFISKFMIVRLIYTNNGNKKLIISDVNINAKSVL